MSKVGEVPVACGLDFMRHVCSTLRVLTTSVPEWCGKLRLNARGCCTCVRASDQMVFVSCIAPHRTNPAGGAICP